MTELALIAAVAANGVIGADGELPWHYPADLRHFKETTTGHPVIMGRRTFESIVDRIGRPLPERTSVVLTTRGLDPGDADWELRDPDEGSLAPDGGAVVAADSVDAAVDAVETTGADVAYVVGGASVYEQFLPRADRLVITEIEAAHEGDTYFPAFEEAAWTETGREERSDLAFVTYERTDRPG
jgi:dihydrofolate reductase